MNVVEVKFSNIKRSEYFFNDGFNLSINMNVIVEGNRGLLFGEVIKIFDDISKFSDLELGSVVRIATKKDYHKNISNIKKQIMLLKSVMN